MAEPDFDFEFFGIRFTDPEILRQTIERGQALVDANDRHARALGQLCMSYAALDGQITRLYQPLLNCTEAQAFCIADDGISRKCTIAIKLIHLEILDEQWRNWIIALLKRVDGELRKLRNRYVHDIYHIDATKTVKIDRTARLEKSQSRQTLAIVYEKRQTVTIAEIDKVGQRVGTVSIALWAAKKILDDWRQTGHLAPFDAQWLPAGKLNARCLNYQAHPQTPEKPLVPLLYEFD